MSKSNVFYNLVCILIAVLVTHGTRSVPIMVVKGKIKNQFIHSLAINNSFIKINFIKSFERIE